MTTLGAIDSNLTGGSIFREPGVTVFSINNLYNAKTARFYLDKHKSSLWRRVSNLCEERMAVRALAMAGDPKSVLDLPCGAGRFWELLARAPDRYLIAADYSQDMIKTALGFQPPHIVHRFEVFQTSAFEINLPDAAVDCVFSMRLLHHYDTEEARAKILHEFRRVSRQSVCVSLWVDGNIQAWHRRFRSRHGTRPDQTRFLFDRSQIENEFVDCGFVIAGSVDMMPGISAWRTYILKQR